METGIKRYFGKNLTILLSKKILVIYPEFDAKSFQKEAKTTLPPLELVARTAEIARLLKKNLPSDYKKTIKILVQIFGPENERETGMFTTGYWLWPVGKFIELYGVDYFQESMDAIYELTKRHTGEYAIRPFINRYPEKSLRMIKIWATDKNFHVRRLASEGVRPRLPWSQKLTLFVEHPIPVFEILELLKDDNIKFVQKSVANNINDYLKDNPEAAYKLLEKWSKNPTESRKWIIKHALRNEIKKKSKRAENILKLL